MKISASGATLSDRFFRIKCSHHAHIFVFQVVAMEHKRSCERSELNKHSHLSVGPKNRGVLLGGFVFLRRLAVN